MCLRMTGYMFLPQIFNNLPNRISSIPHSTIKGQIVYIPSSFQIELAVYTDTYTEEELVAGEFIDDAMIDMAIGD